MAVMKRQAGAGNRIVFLDNLRTAMVFLVVLYHSGAVYESSGLFASFWLVDDPATNDFVGILNVVIDIFVMPSLFFVSGFLAPPSLKSGPGWTFLARRFRRLMVPWLIAVLTLMPLYKVIFLYSRGLPQEPWTTYFHFSNGILSQSWLWFLPVLFLFDALLWLLAATGVKAPKVGLKTAVASVLLISVLFSFAISILGLTGWTHTVFLDFQNERLLPYLLFFLLGAVCFGRGVFDARPVGKRLYIAACCTVWIPINVYIIVLFNFLLRPGTYVVSLVVDLLVMWTAFHLSSLMLLYVLVATYRYWLNTRGRLGAVLNASSYGVYVIHMAVLGVIALLLLPTGIPSLGKYTILTILTFAVSNALVYGYRAFLKEPPTPIPQGATP